MATRPIGKAPRLIDALTGTRGLVITQEVELAPLNTFRIGGAARLFVEVESEQALCVLLEEVGDRSVPFFLLGIGSNVLVPDAGFPGVVARLGGELCRTEFDRLEVKAGGAVPLSKLARESIRRGLVGLESLAGFPSTVGGAVRMNAGSYGTEISDLLVSARVVDHRGKLDNLSVDELDAGYRTARLQATGEIVTEAVLRLRQGDPLEGGRRIKELGRKRWQSLPSGRPNVGSIFRNPIGVSAGKLIDECDLKGVAIGGAEVSREHGNVIVNTGGATAGEVLELMARIYEAVAEKYAIFLEPEVVLVGETASIWRAHTGAVRERLDLSRGERSDES